VAGLLIEYIGNKLNNAAAVTALVNTADISYGLRPQQTDTLPAINYFEVDKAVSDRAVVGTYEYQISCRAADLKTTHQVADAVETALANLVSAAESVDVQATELRSAVTVPEPEIDAYHIAITMAFVVLSDTA